MKNHKKIIVTIVCVFAATIMGFAGYNLFLDSQSTLLNNKVPFGSRVSSTNGTSGVTYKTYLSKADVENFYNDYFSTLEETTFPPSTPSLSLQAGEKCYYDKSAGVIYRAKVDTYDGFGGLRGTHFTVYADVYNGEAGTELPYPTTAPTQ